MPDDFDFSNITAQIDLQLPALPPSDASPPDTPVDNGALTGGTTPDTTAPPPAPALPDPTDTSASGTSTAVVPTPALPDPTDTSASDPSTAVLPTEPTLDQFLHGADFGSDWVSL